MKSKIAVVLALMVIGFGAGFFCGTHSALVRVQLRTETLEEFASRQPLAFRGNLMLMAVIHRGGGDDDASQVLYPLANEKAKAMLQNVKSGDSGTNDYHYIMTAP